MSTKITQLDLVGQCFSGCRSYIHSWKIIELATDKFKKTGKGITYKDLMDAGIALHKTHAQDILKYHLTRGNIFTLKNMRPQQYYPTKIKAEVIEKITKNTLIDPTGVTHSNTHLSTDLESITIQTLEGYVLPLLPTAPLYIHNMHFKLTITPERYTELKLKEWKQNNGKYLSEIIGTTGVKYVFYPNGTIEAYTESSNNPHKLESEYDRSRLLTFFGQLRDRLITFLADRHERIVPGIMEWELTQCDINKDIKVSDWFQFTGVKIQVKHLDHLFRIYIKSMGKDTVCRVEESCNPNRPVVQAISEVFNPNEKIEKQIAEYGNKLSQIHNMLTELTK
jgi:hypothetical protein